MLCLLLAALTTLSVVTLDVQLIRDLPPRTDAPEKSSSPVDASVGEVRERKTQTEPSGTSVTADETTELVIQTSAGASQSDLETLMTDIPEIRGSAVKPELQRLSEDLWVLSFGEILSSEASRGVSDALVKSSAIIGVEPNAPLRLFGDSDETSITRSSVAWNLDRLDQDALPLDSQFTVSNRQGSGVTVYVVDTGIRATHSEFGSRVLPGFTAFNDGCGTDDFDGHGTHVAGTISGLKYGVASSSTLVPVRVFSCNPGVDGQLSDLLLGLDWIIAHHSSGAPAVANLSLGLDGVSPMLDSRIRDVISDGVVLTTASGNESADACLFSPARVSEAITVNASTTADDDASFSNYGACTDIYAPGVNISSAAIASDDSFATAQGTSMAAPHVAGVAALILSEKPSYAPSQVWETIATSATPVNFYPQDSADAKLLLFARILRFSATGSPTIEGSAVVGSRLRLTATIWIPTPDSLKIQWFRDNSAIDGAINDSYTPVLEDENSTIHALISGQKRRYFPFEMNTNAVIIKSGEAPKIERAPSISGTTAVGGTLLLNLGAWFGSPRPSSHVQWLRCRNALLDSVPIPPSHCELIAGATNSWYVTTSADAGTFISAVISVSNELGRMDRTALNSRKIDSSSPLNLAQPGLNQEGTTWSLDSGAWTGMPSPTLRFSWLRCNQVPENMFEENFQDCEIILGVNSSRYDTTIADSGKYLLVTVTASNRLGFSTASVSSSFPVGSP